MHIASKREGLLIPLIVSGLFFWSIEVKADRRVAVERETSVDRSQGTSVDRSQGSRVDRSQGTSVDRSQGTSVDRSQGTRVDRSHGARVDRPRVTRVDRSYGARVDRPRQAGPYRSNRAFSVPRTVPRSRYYRGVRVERSHGGVYPGFGFFYTDGDAFKWLAFASITLKLLDNLNESQQRMHEQAQVMATTAELGEEIIWEDGDASGTVITTRVGTSTSGRQCREFQQTVTIGGNQEDAYGVACLQPDGSWEIVQQ